MPPDDSSSGTSLWRLQVMWRQPAGISQQPLTFQFCCAGVMAVKGMPGTNPRHALCTIAGPWCLLSHLLSVVASKMLAWQPLTDDESLWGCCASAVCSFLQVYGCTVVRSVCMTCSIRVWVLPACHGMWVTADAAGQPCGKQNLQHSCLAW